MARLRSHDPTGDVGVPVELLNPQHLTWSDPTAFAEWCMRHDTVVTGAPLPTTWAERFQRARDTWAIAIGICPPGRRPTRTQLARLGIPHSGALDRAWALGRGR